MEKPEKGRYVWCDVLRTLAIISVVFCHSTERIYRPATVEMAMAAGRSSWLFRTVGFTFGRLGVPIFLLLSGFLLLSQRENDNDYLKRFFKKNFLSLIITVEAWIFLNRIYLHLTNKPFLWSDYVQEALFLKNQSMSHYWYIPMIVGIYAAIPFLSVILNHLKSRLLLIPLFLAAVIGIFLPSLNHFLQIYFPALPTVQFVVNTAFFGGTYGVYIICGYLIGRKKAIRNIHSGILMIILVALLMILVKVQVDSYALGRPFNVFYDSIILLCCGILLFELFSRFFQALPLKLSNFFAHTARLSFGVFFIHNLIIAVLAPFAKEMTASRPLQVMIVFALSFLSSYLLAFLISRVPKLSKILLNV